MSISSQTAYHEAGHAVLAHITGVYVIDGPITTSGSTVAETPLKRDAQRCLARIADEGKLTNAELDYEEAIIVAGGPEAERIYLMKNGLVVDEDALFLGAHGDVSHVQSLLGPQQWSSVCAAASKYLMEPDTWKVVERLASAILKMSGTLTENQATNILEDMSAELDIAHLRVLR